MKQFFKIHTLAIYLVLIPSILSSQNNAIFNGGNSSGFCKTCKNLSGNIGPLPIELLYFYAECQNNTTQFRWSTASETNNNFFSIEFSLDATRWEVDGTAKGAGNSTTVNYYTYVTQQAINRNYFRLCQTDFDGTRTCSNIIAAKNCADTIGLSLNIFPNPSSGIFKIGFDDINNITSTSVYSSNGALVYYSETFSNTIDLSDQPNGIYSVNINYQSQLFTKKVVLSK